MWGLTPMKEGSWPAWRRRPCGRWGRPRVVRRSPQFARQTPFRSRKKGSQAWLWQKKTGLRAGSWHTVHMLSGRRFPAGQRLLAAVERDRLSRGSAPRYRPHRARRKSPRAKPRNICHPDPSPPDPKGGVDATPGMAISAGGTATRRPWRTPTGRPATQGIRRWKPAPFGIPFPTLPDTAPCPITITAA